MNFISQMLSPRSLSNSFMFGSIFSLFILPEYLNNFIGVPCRHSEHLKTEEEFILNLVRTPEIRGASSMLSYRFASIRAILFIHPEYFKSCFPSQSSGGHHFGIFLHSKFSAPFIPIFVPVLRSS